MTRSSWGDRSELIPPASQAPGPGATSSPGRLRHTGASAPMHRHSLRSVLRSALRSLHRRGRSRPWPGVLALGSSLRQRWGGAGRRAQAVWAAGGLSALAVGAVVVAVTMIATGSPGPGHRHRPIPVVADPDPGQRPQAAFAASAPPAPTLPAAAEPPAPPPPALAAAPALRPHELFGFAPYWTLDRQAAFDVRHLTTVAYFGLEIGKDGALSRSGPEWTGFQSQALADL